MHYPLLEHNGQCASISVEATHGGRWKASVTLERGEDFARLKVHPTPVAVPNSFPSQSEAVQAAYGYARRLIEDSVVYSLSQASTARLVRAQY